MQNQLQPSEDEEIGVLLKLDLEEDLYKRASYVLYSVEKDEFFNKEQE